MPKDKPKSPINTKAFSNLIRSPSVTNKLKKQPHGFVPVPVPEQSMKENVEVGQSSQARRRSSEETVRAKARPITEEARNALEEGLPAIGLPDQDPFPKQTDEFIDQTAQLYHWFDNCNLETSLFNLWTAIEWDLFDVTSQKMLFIHGERRVMTALRENQTLRIQGGMLGQDGVALRAFADMDIVDAEERGVIMKLEGWSDKVSDHKLGKKPPLEVMQVTIAAMAKTYHRIQYQNTSLADEVARGYLMSAWIDDAQARLNYPPSEGAIELDQLRFGARVLLKGALEIHDRITACVESFNEHKGWAMELEKLTGRQLGFEHLRDMEKAQVREMRTQFRFTWDTYTMETMFWRPVPDGLFDLWRTNPANLRFDLGAMLERSGINELNLEGNTKLAENFTRSLARGAKLLHLIDREVRELKKVMKERWKDVKAAAKDVKASGKDVKVSEKDVEVSAKGKAPVKED
jgi:hypothetical protein